MKNVRTSGQGSNKEMDTNTNLMSISLIQQLPGRANNKAADRCL